MKLNIGSGLKRIDGYKNIDIDPNVNPDYLIDLETGVIPLEDNSVSEVKAIHVLEHIGEGFFKLLQEIYRVCKDGALIYIEVPHHRANIFFGDLTHIRPITVESLLQLSKKYNNWHIEKFGSSSGHGIRFNIDFEIVSYNLIPTEYWAEKFKEMSKEEILFVSDTYNNVYSELHCILQVIK